jgi:hypothetical protein
MTSETMMNAGGTFRTSTKILPRNLVMQSEMINELATALSKAQAQITGALKDSSNPFFKSKYADLASCWDACRAQLTQHGLSVMQTTDVLDGVVVVRTILAHASGQWVSGVLPVKAKDDGPQAQGSGITYARRYALAAIVGLAQVDDDAEAAQARTRRVEPDAGILKLIAAAESVSDLTALFKSLSEEQRAPMVDSFAARRKVLDK